MKISADSSIATAASASAELTKLDASIRGVNSAIARMGAQARGLEAYSTNVTKLQDTLETGIGNLVDADLARESAKFAALQTKQQLGTQALSIANQNAANLLSLFR